MAGNNENVSLTDIENESQMNIELSETESKIMDEGIHSTPIQNNKTDDNDMMKYLCSLLCSMKESSEKQNAMLELKFNESKSDSDAKFKESSEKQHAMLELKFDEIKSDSDAKFNIQNNKLDELKNDIQEMNKRLENTNETIRTNLNKLEHSIERMGVVVMNPNKNNTNENYNDMCKNVVLDEELTNENNIESSNVFEKVVTESEMLKVNNESTEGNNEILMCVYESESCLLYTSRCV